jgi:UDP-glucuronate decarboxylase
MIRWITESLGTAAYNDVFHDQKNFQIVDVRDLVDKRGNNSDVICKKIDEIIDFLNHGKKVVICCDHGISRSNAIAAGVLSLLEGIPFSDAIQRIISSTGEKKIKIQMLSAVRKATAKNISENDEENTQKTILITGGSGFIGSQLVRQLSEYRIISPSREQIDLIKGALDLDFIIKEENVDCIVHLANPRIYTDNEAMGTSLVMLKNVIDVCCDNKIKLIYPSGWEIYSGYRSNFLIASEYLPAHPKGIYGETKTVCENILEYSKINDNLEYLILRFSPIYGGGDKPKFIYNFIDKAVKNEVITTHQYLNGYPTLDLLYIDDAISAFKLAMNKNLTGSINIGSGLGHSTNDVAEMIVKQLKSKSKIQHKKINDYAPNIVMDTAMAKKVLEWEPRTSLDEGIGNIIQKNKCVGK